MSSSWDCGMTAVWVSPYKGSILLRKSDRLESDGVAIQLTADMQSSKLSNRQSGHDSALSFDTVKCPELAPVGIF
jgi:hypothetical protein